MKIDLHIHSNLSACSTLTLDEILAEARAKGLNGVCITDHDTMAARRLIRPGQQPDGLLVVIGMEYATTGGDFLVFGPFDHLPPGLTARALLTLVQAKQGVAIAAHPCRRGRSTDPTLFAGGQLQLIEGVNGRTSPVDNELAQAYGRLYGCGLVGGSDAHRRQEVGRVTTIFPEPLYDQQQFIAALRTGRFGITSSPLQPATIATSASAMATPTL